MTPLEGIRIAALPACYFLAGHDLFYEKVDSQIREIRESKEIRKGDKKIRYR